MICVCAPIRFRSANDQDISAVCAAFALRVADGAIVDARVAFGGMAATPQRAPHAEAALAGAAWDETTARRAMDALAADYQPLTDMRATHTYRLKVARNLLWRFYLRNARRGARCRPPTSTCSHSTQPGATRAR